MDPSPAARADGRRRRGGRAGGRAAPGRPRARHDGHAGPLLAPLGRGRVRRFPRVPFVPRLPATAGGRLLGRCSPSCSARSRRRRSGIAWRSSLGLSLVAARVPDPGRPASVPGLGVPVRDDRALPGGAARRPGAGAGAVVVRRDLCLLGPLEARRLVLPRAGGNVPGDGVPAARAWTARRWPAGRAGRGDPGDAGSGRSRWRWRWPAGDPAARAGGGGRPARGADPDPRALGAGAQHDRPGLERGDDGRGLDRLRPGACRRASGPGRGREDRRRRDGWRGARSWSGSSCRWASAGDTATPGRRTALYASHVERTEVFLHEDELGGLSPTRSAGMRRARARAPGGGST